MRIFSFSKLKPSAHRCLESEDNVNARTLLYKKTTFIGYTFMIVYNFLVPELTIKLQVFLKLFHKVKHINF